MGDPAGISGEIILEAYQTLAEKKSTIAKRIIDLKKKKRANFYVAGDAEYLLRVKRALAIDVAVEPIQTYATTFEPFKRLMLFPRSKINMDEFAFGIPRYGRESLAYLDFAIEEAKRSAISAIVTAPITKESIASFTPGFLGHTEYLAQAFSAERVRMCFYTPDFLLALQTIHIPLKNVAQTITEQSVFESLTLLSETCERYLGEKRPVAMLALNPHAGEHGLMGTEEETILAPALHRARKAGIEADGPFPADSFFIDRYKRYALILAMYHDQGLIPVKALYPRISVNVTAGLPVARVSVDHGSGYDIAGKGIADETGLLYAMHAALEFI